MSVLGHCPRDLLSPVDVLAGVEVLSPGTRRTDGIAKVADCAEATITLDGVDVAIDLARVL